MHVGANITIYFCSRQSKKNDRVTVKGRENDKQTYTASVAFMSRPGLKFGVPVFGTLKKHSYHNLIPSVFLQFMRCKSHLCYTSLCTVTSLYDISIRTLSRRSELSGPKPNRMFSSEFCSSIKRTD